MLKPRRRLVVHGVESGAWRVGMGGEWGGEGSAVLEVIKYYPLAGGRAGGDEDEDMEDMEGKEGKEEKEGKSGGEQRKEEKKREKEVKKLNNSGWCFECKLVSGEGVVFYGNERLVLESWFTWFWFLLNLFTHVVYEQYVSWKEQKARPLVDEEEIKVRGEKRGEREEERTRRGKEKRGKEEGKRGQEEGKRRGEKKREREDKKRDWNPLESCYVRFALCSVRFAVRCALCSCCVLCAVCVDYFIPLPCTPLLSFFPSGVA